MNTEQALCHYIEELRTERDAAKAAVRLSGDGLRAGVKAEQDLEAVVAERDELKARISHDTLLIQSLFDLIPIKLAPGSPHIHTAVKALADAYDAARAEIASLTRDIESARIGAATIAAQEAAPLPDGVPGEVWIQQGEYEESDYVSRDEIPRSEHYLHSSLVAAKVAEERGLIMSAVLTECDAGAWARITSTIARIREGKPESVSARCRRTGVQACHFCDDLKCGDNTGGKP